MQSQGHRVINRMICQRMGKVEDLTQKMFHEATSKELEKEFIDATDTTNLGLKNSVLARLNTIIEFLENERA